MGRDLHASRPELYQFRQSLLGEGLYCDDAVSLEASGQEQQHGMGGQTRQESAQRPVRYGWRLQRWYGVEPSVLNTGRGSEPWDPLL